MSNHQNSEMSQESVPKKSFLQLCNLTVGFFGVQFGWALQMSNTSAIYEYLGANPEDIPILWLAAPLSGLIAQPIIGYFSDRTWTPLGRRRPYFLAGAILSSLALIFMPNSSSLWMAAGLLWIMDTSINLTTEPFRAFIADRVPESQRTRGFAMQAFFIGSGAVVAATLPWFLHNIVGLQTSSEVEGYIPATVKISYYVGASVFLSTILWTVLTTNETPPKDMNAFNKRNEESQGFTKAIQEIWGNIVNMPETMRQLAVVQFFTWLGMFCVFLYLPPAIAHHIFDAASELSDQYTEGIEWAGICIALYNGTCFIVSLLLFKVAKKLGRKLTHIICLSCGSVGLISMLFIDDKYTVFLSMIGLGIAWSSILSIPYSMLSDALPQRKMGIYMGLFNAFIVIPQIVAALGLGWVMEKFLNYNHLYVVVLGGFSFAIAALCVPIINDVTEEDNPSLSGQVPVEG